VRPLRRRFNMNVSSSTTRIFFSAISAALSPSVSF
jgi:hypothetical protein